MDQVARRDVFLIIPGNTGGDFVAEKAQMLMEHVSPFRFGPVRINLAQKFGDVVGVHEPTLSGILSRGGITGLQRLDKFGRNREMAEQQFGKLGGDGGTVQRSQDRREIVRVPEKSGGRRFFVRESADDTVYR